MVRPFAEHNKIEKKALKNKFGEILEDEISKFVIENAEKVIRFAALDNNSISKSARELKQLSLNDDTSIFLMEREDGKNPYYIFKGNIILFAKHRLKEIDGILTFSEPVTDIWADVLPNDLHNEGGVEFRKGKKPEKLLQRIFELTTEPGDWILDCFGGSGSTFAVSTKMERRWIGLEIGEHADTHIIPRLKNVLEGKDGAGITKAVNWQGGGSFKYYHLGDSIIKLNEDGTGDFNWNLGKEFIQESFLSSYDYIIDNTIDFKEGELFTDKRNQPLVGVQSIGTKKRVAVITINEPNENLETLSYEEMQSIYRTVKKKYSPEYINIFTNRGIEIAYDSKPDDLEVVKIPNAIFAELEK